MTRAFLALEIAGLNFQTLDLTRQRPIAIDLVFSLSAVGALDSAPVQAFALARGLGPSDEGRLLTSLAAETEAVETLERNPKEGVWFGTLRFRALDLADRRASAVLAFAAEAGLGIGWIRIEEGVTFLRAEVPMGGDPYVLLDACRAFLRRSSIDAHVEVEAASSRDVGPWMELLLRTLDRHRSAGPSPRR